MAGYQHILLAIDVCAEYQTVIDKALDIAGKNTRLSVIHIVEPIYYPESYVGALTVDLQQKAVEFAESELNHLVEKYQMEGKHIDVGSPPRKIRDYAKSVDADLIVVGSHGKHGVQLLLGSTASGVLHGAHCDVLAVRVVE